MQDIASFSCLDVEKCALFLLRNCTFLATSFSSHGMHRWLNSCSCLQAELLKEGLVDLGDIQYTDNGPLLDLFLTKPIGLISLLDEQCRGFNVSVRKRLEGYLALP